MKKPDISILNKRDIKNGKFTKLLPELYGLKEVIENSPWHDQELVFDHVLSVLDGLEKIIHNSNKEIKSALAETIDRNSRKDLLYLAALLYDIGKKEKMVDLDTGSRCAPGHEKEGGRKVRKILKRFDLSLKESRIITNIVRSHGIIHDIIGLSLKDFRKEYKNFKKRFSDIYLELILLAFADTVNSYLKKTKPSEFRHRINFYKKELVSWKG